MEISLYKKLKELGNIKMVKATKQDVLYYSSKYDVNTGEEGTPESGIIRLKELLDLKQKTEETLENINEMIGDIESILNSK